ncbi:MAG: SDR family oxidoreductase, partial [Aestuariibacter sp.]|nr:SDR family oxidoreductase [Aestuariibacter sp.]
MMTILVVGATGMTGRLVVEQLLEKGHKVRVIVRSPDNYSAEVLKNPNLAIVEAAILDLSDEVLADLVANCHAVVSCLGHVMDFRGLFGNPRRLCTDAAQRLC